MGKELSMVECNDQGKLARQYFIECEERLRRIAPEEHEAAIQNWRKNRVAACEDHKSMADAMKGYIERTGDNQHGFACSNEQHTSTVLCWEYTRGFGQNRKVFT